MTPGEVHRNDAGGWPPDGPSSTPFGSVTSIGSHCMTAMQLKLAGLKLFSGPFDWIFSNLRMVCDCLDDDFRTLLDRDLHLAIPPERRPAPDTNHAQHAVFGDSYGLDPIFNHYDPTAPAGSAYLRRCVDRFRTALAAREPQLLLGICYPGKGAEADVDRLAALLDGSRAVAWVMHLHDRQGRRGVEVRRRVGPHQALDLFAASRADGVNFEDAADNLFVQDYLRATIRLDPSLDPRRSCGGT